MKLPAEIIKAKALIEKHEGAVAYITEKGRTYFMQLPKGKTVKYKIYVLEGKVKIEDGNGKTLFSKLPGTSNADIDGDTQQRKPEPVKKTGTKKGGSKGTNPGV